MLECPSLSWTTFRWMPVFSNMLAWKWRRSYSLTCRLPGDTDTVPSKEIDSFIAASSRPEFTQRLLIAASDIYVNLFVWSTRCIVDVRDTQVMIVTKNVNYIRIQQTVSAKD